VTAPERRANNGACSKHSPKREPRRVSSNPAGASGTLQQGHATTEGLRSGNAWAAQMFLAARQETIIPKRESRPSVWGDPPRPPASCGFPLEPPSRSEVEYQGASAIPRELIEPHRGDKRHVTSQKRKVVRSAKQCQPPLSADRRSKAKTIVEGRGGIAGISFQVSRGTW
jgi:hypothetical protein